MGIYLSSKYYVISCITAKVTENNFQTSLKNQNNNKRLQSITSKCLTTRTCKFPSESFRVRWIRWIPSDRFSTPTSNMGIISRLEHAIFHRKLGGFLPRYPIREHLSKCLMTRTCPFPLESDRVRWNGWIPSDRFSNPISNMG